MRESGLTLEPGYLLVIITTKASNFPLRSCFGKERDRTDVCYQLKVAYYHLLFFLLGRRMMSTTNHDSSLFMSYLGIIS